MTSFSLSLSRSYGRQAQHRAKLRRVAEGLKPERVSKAVNKTEAKARQEGMALAAELAEERGGEQAAACNPSPAESEPTEMFDVADDSDDRLGMEELEVT